MVYARLTFKPLLETKSTANGVAKYPGATVLGASEARR